MSQTTNLSGRATVPPYRWPEEMVDETRLFEVVGYSSGDPSIIGPEAYQKVRSLEAAVDRARVSGRLKRFTAKNAQTGEITAYGYRRADVLKVIGAVR